MFLVVDAENSRACLENQGLRDMSRQRTILGVLRSRAWRDAILAAVSAWNRNQVRQVITAVFMTWLLGATALYLAERRVNSDFANWGDALWGVWVVLFSGMDQDPKTTAGRLVMMVLLVLGVGLAGLFTASLASLLIERYLRRRDVTTFEMENHPVGPIIEMESVSISKTAALSMA
jgi:voltage-gated potassium channel